MAVCPHQQVLKEVITITQPQCPTQPCEYCSEALEATFCSDECSKKQINDHIVSMKNGRVEHWNRKLRKK
jgi:hypothetical protein